MQQNHPKRKNNYWFNFYSPIGNYENILLLPILYVLLVPGILILIKSKGLLKIYGILWLIVPIYSLIYDAIYKYKKEKTFLENEIDDSKLRLSYVYLIKGIKLTVAIILTVIIIYLFLNSKGTINKFIISPFCLCIFCYLGFTVAEILNKTNLKKIFLKSYVLIFLLYWFGIIIFACYNFIKNKEYMNVIMTTPFWLVGIMVICKYLKK